MKHSANPVLATSFIILWNAEAVPYSNEIQYSEKYYDSTHEYRHVVLPKEMAKLVPKNRLMTEVEWRSLGVQQSRGWIHYSLHKSEPHILLFTRRLQDRVVPPPNRFHPVYTPPRLQSRQWESFARSEALRIEARKARKRAASH